MKEKLSIGDVFEVKLENGKKYMQYIGNDWKQLNSIVVRVFKTIHDNDTPFSLELIRSDNEEFCFHLTNLKQGEKEGLWKKVANDKVLHSSSEVVFKGSYDYGNPEVKVSKNWYVWILGEDSSHDVDCQDEVLSRAYIGNITQPQHLYEMIKNKGIYQGFYPKHK